MRINRKFYPMVDGDFSKVPKFLKRLYREATDPTNAYIQWSEDGDKIRIVNKPKFIKHTLPTLSRTKEYSAFIRQLNIYGFVKTKNEKNEDIEEYYNSFFKRDEPHLMNYIKRVKKYEKIETKLNYPTIEHSITFLTNSNFRLSNELSQLKEKVEKQERTINGLLEILGKVFRTGAQTIASQNQVSQVPFDYPLTLLQDSTKDKDNTKQNQKFIPLPREQKKDDEKISDMNDFFF